MLLSVLVNIKLLGRYKYIVIFFMNVSFLNTHPHIGLEQHQYLFDNVMLQILTNLVIKHSQKDENQLLLMKLIRRDTRKP